MLWISSESLHYLLLECSALLAAGRSGISGAVTVAEPLFTGAAVLWCGGRLLCGAGSSGSVDSLGSALLIGLAEAVFSVFTGLGGSLVTPRYLSCCAHNKSFYRIDICTSPALQDRNSIETERLAFHDMFIF